MIFYFKNLFIGYCRRMHVDISAVAVDHTDFLTRRSFENHSLLDWIKYVLKFY